MYDRESQELEPFRYCPMCATELAPPRPGENGAYCPAHERSWYRNFSPTVGCALVRDGKALVTVRGIEPERGRYDVPGGFLEPGEHPIDGLRREAREELGVEVEEVSSPLTMATTATVKVETTYWSWASRLASRRGSPLRRTTPPGLRGSRSKNWTGWTSPGSTTGIW